MYLYKYMPGDDLLRTVLSHNYVSGLNAFQDSLLHSIHCSLDLPCPNTSPHRHMLGSGSGRGSLTAHQPDREHCCRILCSVHITGVGKGSEVLSFQVQLLTSDHNTAYGMEPPASKLLYGAWMGLNYGQGMTGAGQGGSRCWHKKRTAVAFLVLFGFT